MLLEESLRGPIEVGELQLFGVSSTEKNKSFFYPESTRKLRHYYYTAKEKQYWNTFSDCMS